MRGRRTKGPDRRKALALVAILSCPGLAFGSDDLAGRWEGAVALPGISLEIGFELARHEDRWIGSVDIPLRDVRGLPVSVLSAESQSVVVAIADGPEHGVLRGRLNPDGTRLAGYFTEGGSTFPVLLERIADGPEPPPEWIDDLSETALRTWEVPGLVAVVVGPDVEVVRGAGRVDVESDAPVTPTTPFGLGSATKPFTAMLLATLVAGGDADWDSPVVEILPEFDLVDPWAAERATVADLLAHRLGLPAHDHAWRRVDRSRDELVRAMGHLEPTIGFRSGFAYQSLGYVVAGIVAERLGGSPWKQLVAKKLLEPLGMTGAGFRDEVGPTVVGHGSDGAGRIVRDPPGPSAATLPALGLVASGLDLLAWLRFELGLVSGPGIPPRAIVDDLREPRIVVDRGVFRALSADLEVPIVLHGLGWFVQVLQGRTVVHHGGTGGGFSSFVAVAPREGVGVAVLANRDESLIAHGLGFDLLERALGSEPAGWTERLRQRWLEMEAEEERFESFRRSRLPAPAPPPLPMDAYTGSFVDPGYGELAVEAVDELLGADLGGIETRLRSLAGGVFLAEGGPLDGVLFAPEIDGAVVTGWVAPLEPSVDPIRFERSGVRR